MGAGRDGVDPSLLEGMDALVQVASDAGISPRITSTIRTAREQSYLYKRWISGASALPAAPPGHSAHEYGWAFDMIVEPMDYLPELGKIWHEWGGTYGGKDYVHFELRGAGKLASQLGQQADAAADPEAAGPTIWAKGPVGGAQPGTQSTADGGIGLLPPRWRKRIYQAEDIGLGFVPGVGTVQMISTLLQWGYPDSEILKILSSPVEELHQIFPWIPF